MLPSGLASISSQFDDTPQVRGAVAFGRMVREGEPVMGWQPIETAPQTDEDILVAASYFDEADVEHRYTTISSYLDQPYRRGFRHRNGAKNATHWMPLPEPTAVPEQTAIDRHAALVIGSAYRSADRR